VSQPRVLRSIQDLLRVRSAWTGKEVGFVPTMGALHDGHKTLLLKSRAENEISVLSIFVNPTQFNDKKDLEKYPKTWDSDLSIATEARVDFIFAPDFAEMYPDNYAYQVMEKDFSKFLCGQDRPGHFDGVLTVVMKLFHLVKPSQAYFGEKDYQQLHLIQGMVSAFFMDLKVTGVLTVREQDGLAMSSRNLRLTETERDNAPFLHRTLTSAPSAPAAAQALNEAGFDVDYVVDKEGRRFAAAKLGSVRLIDNVEI
jgi:pantoate--beta-alanine ligase